MSIGAVLETAIGLIFVFLILGLMVSALQEAFAAMTKLRGKYLLEGLSRLLAGDGQDRPPIWRARNFMFRSAVDNVAGNGSELFESVVIHPLIANTGSNSAPSYIAPENFVTALTDRLRNLGNATSDAPLLAALSGAALAEPPAIDAAGGQPAGAEGGAEAPAPQDAEAMANGLLAEIGHGIDKLPDGPAKTALNAMLAESLGTLEEFQQRLADWYESGMKRLSGVYKRFTQYFALGFGLFFAVALNVDTIQVAAHLWRDPEARAVVVTVAEAYVAEAANAFVLEQNASPPDAAAEAEAPSPTFDEITEQLVQTLNAANAQLEASQLPIGWTGNPVNPFTILGWLLTALAVSLGAPFWFDLLKKFMRIRAAGASPSEDATPAN